MLGKNYSLTALAIDVVPSARWTIAAETLAERRIASAHLDVKVTAGTNTAAEKAEFIERAHAALGAVLGPMAPASYIVIDELPAESWGYGGRTQAARRAGWLRERGRHHGLRAQLRSSSELIGDEQ